MQQKHKYTCVAAAHQPNFFPWLGWFDKLSKADIFIILDDVQFPRCTGSWGNRVKIQYNSQIKWLTATTDKSLHGFHKFNETRMAEHLPWREKCIGMLKHAYGRSPWYEEVQSFLHPILTNPCNDLVQYNMRGNRAIADILGLDKEKFVFASQFKVKSSGTLRLIELAQKNGADAYMYGGGASGYQEDQCFEQHDIGLIAQNFQHPQYSQFHQLDDFLPGLSVIDALFCLGLQGVGKIFARIHEER